MSDFYRIPGLYYDPINQVLNDHKPDLSQYKPGSKEFNEILKQAQSNNLQASNTKHKCVSEDKIQYMSCDHDRSKGRKELEKSIQIGMQNIMNADKPSYKRVSTYKDANGNYQVDQSQGKLIKSDRNTDLAIEGNGQGFLLTNGEYTRDGRFTFNALGQLVTEDKGIPIAIEYTEGVEENWSEFDLKINYKGEIFDRFTGKELGTIKADITDRSKIIQGYKERSNVNMPMEIIELNNQLRLMDIQRSTMTTEHGLNREALNIARGAVQ